MNARTGNLHDEAHGKSLRVFEWTAPIGTDPHAAMLLAESALGCKLHHRGDGEQHGYVNTTRLGNGVLIQVVLYESCDDLECRAGHHGVKHLRHPTPSPQKLRAMVDAIGEVT